MENKKTTVLTIVGVLVMIVMVTGISFALYTFTGTGSKENVITTGQISVSYEESSVIELTNQYPMSDELGIGNTESVMNFTVSGTIRGDANINYAIGLDSIGEGKTIESLEEYHIANHMNSHVMYTDTFTTSGSQAYTIKAWVASNYELPATVSGNNSATTSEQFKFKIKVVGTDQTMTILEDTTPPVIEDIEISKIEETAINYNNLNLKRIA